MSGEKDGVMPEGKWTFDEDVTECFDDMLRRSIPQYDVMRRAVFDAGCRFIKDGCCIIDLGASRGEALAPFVEKFGEDNFYCAIEVSDPMVEVLTERFGNSPTVEIKKMDLREEYPQVATCLSMSILTLQFVPIEHRQKIVRNIYKNLVPGGAFIIVEKVLGDVAELDELMVDIYYQMKRENGYPQDAIDRKRLSLEGVLVPVTARWNEDLLQRAGFQEVDCFWRWMNFAAWIAVKTD